MGMSRSQLRRQGVMAAHKASLLKPPTRKEVQRWLEPIRSAMTMMMQGSYFEYEGDLLMPVPWAEERSMGKLGDGIRGLLSFLNRLKYPGECNHLYDVSNLTVDSDFLLGTLSGALSEIKLIEDFIMTQQRGHLIAEGKTERIAILLEMQNANQHS